MNTVLIKIYDSVQEGSFNRLVWCASDTKKGENSLS